ncbi:MAG: saccharopine dehydrogenase NADP-binding domain-containing protein [Candidatus Acetothermia bacterium]|nr:saccharopine dehydrogenase NADP-binding domain-containing protein [Candidatus Acetothermia bacterium]
MGYRYAVAGAGRQGVAAAYDLARHGDAERVTLVDRDLRAAQAGAARVNALAGQEVAQALVGDVAQPTALAPVLAEVDGLLSAVPYRFNLALTEAAIAARVHMVDLGGHTGIVRQELLLGPHAERAGITVVPDCGMGPGMNITLALAAMSLLDTAEEVRIYDGGLPEDPKPPWGYALLFSAGGLINEYDGDAYFLRDGAVTPVPALSELEELDLPPLGRLEAFVTSGGLSTMPWTFAGRLRTLENKTLRYPGHCLLFRALRDLGLFSQEPLPVGQSAIIPREVLLALLDQVLFDPDVRDVCVIHVRADGRKGGRPAQARVQVVDHYDPATGFRAMERLTGWHAAIVLAQAVRGELPAGAIPIEKALSGDRFLAEAPKRGWTVECSVRPTD